MTVLQFPSADPMDDIAVAEMIDDSTNLLEEALNRISDDLRTAIGEGGVQGPATESSLARLERLIAPHPMAVIREQARALRRVARG